MTTRLYFDYDAILGVTASCVAPEPGSWSAGWNKTAGADTQWCQTTKRGSASDAGESISLSGTSGHFTAIRRSVSPILDVDQSISGTLKGQFLCREALATNDCTLAVAAKVIKPDGTDRGVLLAVSASDDTSTTPPELSTTSTNRKLQDSAESATLTLSSVSALAGDRLVIEVGQRQASTATSFVPIHTGSSNGTDLPEDNTTTTTNDPWVEFSQTITFGPHYYGSASTPADGSGTGTGVADPTAVTPPSGMVANTDLVYMIGHQRATGAALAVSATGGQTWTTHTAVGITNVTARVFTCVYNGTWSTDPSVDFSATTCNSVQMHVFRAPAGYAWSVNQALAETQDAATPFANPGQTTTGTAPTVSLVGWFTPDDNAWSATTGAGWETTGTAQYRNQSGSDQSSSYAHYIQAVGGATGSVSKTQTALGDDACTTFIISFAAVAPVSFIACKPLVIGQSVNRASLY